MHRPGSLQNPSRRAIWSIMIGCTLLLGGLLPVLHPHEAVDALALACQQSEHVRSPHFEAPQWDHNELCVLCSKACPSASFDRAPKALAFEPGAGQGVGDPQILPPGSPGRHGASRAPPTA